MAEASSQGKRTRSPTLDSPESPDPPTSYAESPLSSSSTSSLVDYSSASNGPLSPPQFSDPEPLLEGTVDFGALDELGLEEEQPHDEEDRPPSPPVYATASLPRALDVMTRLGLMCEEQQRQDRHLLALIEARLPLPQQHGPPPPLP
ncbi:hypothetical protein L1987_23334 [Smallanthus sonchifolius]|uniref:Uncharacterized protein n=1 Tax=Smallanthus sonchifolius TaxID=185202 RepID=A0ACB9IHX3_9ASTR|nr:hypothetical protein L1987_23334 [Smallanthus sonchifolius]